MVVVSLLLDMKENNEKEKKQEYIQYFFFDFVCVALNDVSHAVYGQQLFFFFFFFASSTFSFFLNPFFFLSTYKWGAVAVKKTMMM